jgi:hypothetical protein
MLLLKFQFLTRSLSLHKRGELHRLDVDMFTNKPTMAVCETFNNNNKYKSNEAQVPSHITKIQNK